MTGRGPLLVPAFIIGRKNINEKREWKRNISTISTLGTFDFVICCRCGRGFCCFFCFLPLLPRCRCKHDNMIWLSFSHHPPRGINWIFGTWKHRFAWFQYIWFSPRSSLVSWESKFLTWKTLQHWKQKTRWMLHLITEMLHVWNIYPPVNKHSNGKSPSWIGHTSSNGGFSIALLDCRSVPTFTINLSRNGYIGYTPKNPALPPRTLLVAMAILAQSADCKLEQLLFLFADMCTLPRTTSWWLNQPIWKMWFNWDHFPKDWGENKKCLSCHHLDRHKPLQNGGNGKQVFPFGVSAYFQGWTLSFGGRVHFGPCQNSVAHEGCWKAAYYFSHCEPGCRLAPNVNGFFPSNFRPTNCSQIDLPCDLEDSGAL